MISVPPARLLASPMDETFMSIREPARAKAGKDDVTMTAATLLGLKLLP